MAMAKTYSDGTPVEPAAQPNPTGKFHLITTTVDDKPVTEAPPCMGATCEYCTPEARAEYAAAAAPKLSDDEIKAQAEHDFLARYTERKATAYADELADLAGQLRYMADELQRQGLQLAYPNEPAPNFIRAATAAVTVAVDNSRVRVASLLNRAAEAQAALSDLAAWEAQH